MTDRRSDQLTPDERTGACDCLVEIVCEWLTRSLAGQTDDQRGEAVNEVCLYISQMRHRPMMNLDTEQRRWMQRVALRLCAYTPGAQGQEAIVMQNLEARMTVAMLTYREWRERYAPFRAPAPGRPS